ncbi:hypothetical protein BDY21DRAFT_385591 [Lineolata rhizophorae]|uniref:Uncharacterized protein n=1 Tax=Lineolata rhizophorae TaxID=578093 RepID=A0A6A6P1Q0_9PEZI|nr:hypothetical protein BDY21DRAFT_385591 [Lineolata rhizophorae]
MPAALTVGVNTGLASANKPRSAGRDKKEAKAPVVTAASPTSARDATAANSGIGSRPVRLHISPLTPELLPVYLGPALLAQASDVSFHALRAFPDRAYGYVTLPGMEAERARRKLNGSIVRGGKVRVEEARPETYEVKREERKRKSEGEAAEEEAKKKKKKVREEKKKEKMRKAEGILPGVEMPDGRKVKRGWTEPEKKERRKDRKETKREEKDKRDRKKKQQPSLYSEKPEILFKTVVPPNKSDAIETRSKRKDKDKKDKKKKSKKGEEVIVHEFKKHKKHASFLKSSEVDDSNKPVSEYVEGKGWVDADGNVIEEEKKSNRPKRKSKSKTEDVEAAVDGAATMVKSPTSETASSSELSSSEDEDGDEDGDEDKDADEEDEQQQAGKGADCNKVAHSSPTPAQPAVVPATSSPLPSQPTVEVSAPSPTSPAPGSAATPQVHPLEALFKKPAAGNDNDGKTGRPALPAPILTSFSFFGSDDASVAGTDGTSGPPQTPYSRQDMMTRGLRSAAPTPDTAAISRRFSLPWARGSSDPIDEEDEDEAEALEGGEEANELDMDMVEGEVDDEVEEDAERAGSGPDGEKEGEKPKSDFEKWFWENRGRLNRAWKQRRREAMKASRQQENKRMRKRAV